MSRSEGDSRSPTTLHGEHQAASLEPNNDDAAVSQTESSVNTGQEATSSQFMTAEGCDELPIIDLTVEPVYKDNGTSHQTIPVIDLTSSVSEKNKVEVHIEQEKVERSCEREVEIHVSGIDRSA